MRLPRPERRGRAARCAAALALALLLPGCGEGPAPERAFKVGATSLQFVDLARSRPLDVELWYPAAPDAEEETVAYEYAFRGRMARGAPYAGGRRPLVAFSHGDRGANTNQAWLAESLAGQGYVVASVAHWQNTRTNNVPEATMRAWERPQDLSFVISQLLADETWAARIDPARIGTAGYSSGGYTAIALAGAIYQPLRMREYCTGPNAGPDCALVDKVDMARVDFRGASASYRDPRVRAVVALAPALGPGMTPESLRGIAVPTLVVAARDDELVPFAHHAARYANEIPAARLEAVDGGGHFVFMSRCTAAGYAFTWFNAYDICGRRHEISRADVHAKIAPIVQRFFDQTLAPH